MTKSSWSKPVVVRPSGCITPTTRKTDFENELFFPSDHLYRKACRQPFVPSTQTLVMCSTSASVKSAPVGTPRGLSSEREPNLHFQPAIICGFEEPLAAGPTGDLVRAAEQRRCDVADYRSGVGMIQNVLDGHRKAQVVTVAGLGCSDQRAQAPAPGLRHTRGSSAGTRALLTSRASPVGAEPDGLCDPQVDPRLSRAASG